MKKIIFPAVFMLTAVVSLSAQQTIKSDNMSDFHSIALNGNLNVELIRSDANAIDIELFNAEINRLKWEVKNGVLSVSLRPVVGQSVKPRADARIYYRGPLSGISVSGSRLTAVGDIASHVMRITASGGANINGAVDAMDLEVEVSGNSSLLMSGKAKYLTLRSTENSKVDVRKLQAVSADVEAATGAEVYINASERLVANAKTTATIFYAGNPEIFKDRSSKLSTSIGSGVLNIGQKQ